ncbi:MAG: flagellar basal body P-ring formation protein FlgA [Fusobacteriaceae bacterium]|nr:flagellar basal body P-ring formation protein FlgA [Fusobacteriaceae bacterium]MBN2837288.1 flagellar basal body P-ring formation protein FlgA [Fusobacteriaceae bacterium]
MKFKNIIRMAVVLSFLFFNNNKIFANINDYVKIKYENITLWDIAPSYVNEQKGSTIILGKIRIPGGKIFIKGSQINAELVALGMKNVKIPNLVTVERSYVEINTKEIEEKLLQQLKKDNTDFNYNVYIASRETLKMPIGELKYKVSGLNKETLGKAQLTCEVYENERKVYEFPFSLDTAKMIKEYTLIKDVQKGEKYSEEKVQVETKLIYSTVNSNNLEISEKTIFNKNLLAGTKLQKSDLEENAIIRKDDKIFIELKMGGMTISDRGVALTNGDMGQKIQVKNSRSGKVVEGVITAEKTVTIEIE